MYGVFTISMYASWKVHCTGVSGLIGQNAAGICIIACNNYENKKFKIVLNEL